MHHLHCSVLLWIAFGPRCVEGFANFLWPNKSANGSWPMKKMCIQRCVKRGVIGSRGLLFLCLSGYVWLWAMQKNDIHESRPWQLATHTGNHPSRPHSTRNANYGSGASKQFVLQTNETFVTNNSIDIKIPEVWSDEARQFWEATNAERRAASPVPCPSLLEADPIAAKMAINFTNKHPRNHFNDSIFNEITKDCALFTRKRGYFMDPGSKLEEDFPIAFSILFHRNLDTVERLLRAIYRPQHLFCLHLDGKSPDSIHQAALSITKCLPNVFLAQRERIVYAGFSRLKADINCMTDVLNRSGSWKYYINLASEEFPLKTNREIVEILNIYNGANDIEGLDKRNIRSRFEMKWEEEIDANGNTQIRNTHVAKEKPPHGIQIVRGSAYGIFSRAFVNFIINDQRARDLLEWSRDTCTPDEHYWATLHHLKLNPSLKTPGGYKGEPMNKPWLAGYAAWGRKHVDPCLGGHFVHGVCIFGVQDLPQLVGRKELFANKFHLNFQPLALDCVEEWLHNRTLSPGVFDMFYYNQLPFVNNE